MTSPSGPAREGMADYGLVPRAITAGAVHMNRTQGCCVPVRPGLV